MTVREYIAKTLIGLVCGLWLAVPVLAQETLLDDQEIADAVEDQYFLDRAVNINRINIACNDGIVELTGEVGSFLERERATQIAELVKGVRAVSNRLEIVPIVQKSDDTLESEIIRALARDPATDSWEIEVAVNDGIVRLEGEVESWAERELAGQVAGAIDGVMDLDNDLIVDYGAERPDSEIAHDIQQRLYWDVLVNGALIDIEVVDGVVTLNGVVGSAAEKRQAVNDAWIVGVDDVNADGLEVRWWAEPEDLRGDKYVTKSDAAIEQAIRDAMLYDPRVASFRVDPEVEDGDVTLRGTVSNLKAKQAAERLARHTVGVDAVTNRIRVRIGDVPTDEQIAANIRQSLMASPFADVADIDVKVRAGEVMLSGTVESGFERAEAERIASGIKGVTSVTNRLLVSNFPGYVHSPRYTYYPLALTHVPVTYRRDAEVFEQVRDELFWSPFVDHEDVDVTVDNGVVTLTGTVHSWREFYAAQENAREGGATVVVNELEIAASDNES